MSKKQWRTFLLACLFLAGVTLWIWIFFVFFTHVHCLDVC